MNLKTIKSVLIITFFGQNRRSRLFNFIVPAVCLAAVVACSWNKYNGVYSGTLSSETKRLAYDQRVLDTISDEEKDLLVILRQDGDEVFVSITGSRLLGDCSLRARLPKKKDAAYIDSPQACSNSLSMTGTLSVGSETLYLSLGGFTQSSYQTFRFTGLLKK